MGKIEKDHSRFGAIVRGRVKKDFPGIISRGEMIGKRGKDHVSIPIHEIDLPHIIYGPKQAGGVGQGQVQPGQIFGIDGQTGAGGAGQAPGEHILEVELTVLELAEILGEELELPRIEPKGKQTIVGQRRRYTGVRQAGPESLRIMRRTFRRALARQIASGVYDPNAPLLIPVREDKRYRSPKPSPKLQSSAVIFYMLDVSGSMSDEQKEIVRTEAFWIDTWLGARYRGLKKVYVIHDAAARVVDQDAFYRTRESGGTMISSAYRLTWDAILQMYSPADWNIYCFHFSDGDNWGEDDEEAGGLLEKDILPVCNLFCYGEVQSEYGAGHFLNFLEDRFNPGEDDNLILDTIKTRDDILPSIKNFLGKGK